jgi:hypothetical protein
MIRPQNKREAIKEWRRCAKDPVYFIRNYVNIKHPIKGIVPFDLYPFQERIIDDLEKHRFNIIKKFRQAGASTIAAAMALHRTVFKKGFEVVVVSIGNRESMEFLERAVIMYNELPSWLKPKLKSKNAHTLWFNNNSKIRCLPSASNAGRGISASWLIADEAAFIEGMDKFWAAIWPTTSTGGSAFIISTVNGVGGFYYNQWMKALEGSSPFNPIEIHFKEHPDYAKPEWEETIKHGMTHKQFCQEYLCDFLGSGETFIDSDILGRLKDNIQEEFYTKYNNRLRVFKEPLRNREYLMCVDPSLGRGRDYSAYHLIDLYTGEQVQEFYSNKLPLNEFTKIINDEASLYNTAYVVCERNGIGRALIESLFYDHEYENVWMDEKDFGVHVSNHNRDQILGLLEEALREGWFKIRSERSVDELMTFVIDEKSGKVQADEGQHDDLVLALSFGAYAIKKLGANAPMLLNRDYNVDDRQSAYMSISTSNPGRQELIDDTNYRGTGESKEDYLKWLTK